MDKPAVTYELLHGKVNNKRVNNSVIAMFSYNTCIRNIII